MTLGQKLKKARKEKGYTLEELCNIVNEKYGTSISKGTMSRYESDTQEPLFTTGTRIAEALGVSVAYLMSKDSSQPIKPNLIEKYKSKNKNMLSKKNIVIVSNKEKQITMSLMKELPNEEIQNINALIEAYVNTHSKKERK